VSARYECGVCWYAYDADEGDDEWQVAPGTTFEELPEDWRCPRCDGPREGFLRATAPVRSALDARVDALEQAYRCIGDERMRDLPIYNPALVVEAVGFEVSPSEPDVWLGVLVTPWFMNAVRLPQDASLWESRAGGEVTRRALPSGRYDFTLTRVDGVGPIETCSLISPMGGFDDHALARQVAEEAGAELLRPMPAPDEDDARPEQPDEPDDEPSSAPSEPRLHASQRPVSRRGLLRGRLVGGG
jgi:[NiFe] hydrogenase assembly HybE family chaperone